MWKKILPELLPEMCADAFECFFDEDCDLEFDDVLELVFFPVFLTLGFFFPGFLPLGVRVVEGLA